MKFIKIGAKPTKRDYEILSLVYDDEIKIIYEESFYTIGFYETLKEKMLMGGGKPNKDLLVFKYLYYFDKQYLELLKSLIEAKQNSYIPDCYKICSVDDFEKYNIEFAFKNNFMSKEIRNNLHSNTTNHIKAHFYEERAIYNISQNWQFLLNNDELFKFYKAPKVMYIGLINRCNITCTHCRWFGKAHIDGQTTDYFKNEYILEPSKVYECIDFVAKSAGKLVFSGPGEPLLDKNIVNYVRYAKQQGLGEIEIASSGVLLTPKLYEELIEAGLSKFECSFILIDNTYADEKEQKEYYSNLIKLSKNNSILKMDIVCKPYSLSSAMQMVHEFKKNGLKCSAHTYAFDETMDFWKQKELPIYSVSNARHSCAHSLDELYILPDGSIITCEAHREFVGRVDIEKLSFGNVYNNALTDIFYGVKRRKFCLDSLALKFPKYNKKNAINSDSPLFACSNCPNWWNEP